MAAVTVVEGDQLAFVGAAGLPVRAAGRDQSFCECAIETSHQVLVVPDAWPTTDLPPLPWWSAFRTSTIPDSLAHCLGAAVGSLRALSPTILACAHYVATRWRTV